MDVSAVKFYDVFGSEIKVGDRVVTARPSSRKLRIIELGTVGITIENNSYVAEWKSIPYTSSLYTPTPSVFGGPSTAYSAFKGSPSTYQKKTVTYHYGEVKFYRRHHYMLKHGVKFNRIMKVHEDASALS